MKLQSVGRSVSLYPETHPDALYDIDYFTTPTEAETFADRTGATVLQTSPGAPSKGPGGVKGGAGIWRTARRSR